MFDALNGCPPKKRAAATKPTAHVGYGFVEASPSRALRGGEGRFPLKLSHHLKTKLLDTPQATPYTSPCWTRGDLRQLAPRKKLLKSRTSTQTEFFEPSPSLARRVLLFRKPLTRRQTCG